MSAPVFTPDGFTPDVFSAEETTLDAFLGGLLTIAQPKTGYRAGLDAVFLAAAVPCRVGVSSRVLDVGAGVGTVGLCLAARCPDAQVWMLEGAPQLVAMGADNITRNGLTGRVRIVNGSVGATAAEVTRQGLAADSFDHILANPPYHAEGRGTQAPDPLKAASHAMPDDTLDDWVRYMARMARPGGSATMIHKAQALPQLLTALGPRFGNLRVLPIHPRLGEPANRVIVQGRKGSRAPLVLLPGFVLHAEGNAFTPAAQAILRDGAALMVHD